MKSAEFSRYIHMGIVGRVFISDKTEINQGFEIYVHGITHEFDNYIALHGRTIDSAKDKRRQWTDLGRAHKFITDSGWTEKVYVECYAQ